MKTNKYIIAAVLTSVSLASPAQAQTRFGSVAPATVDTPTFEPIEAAQVELITYPSLLAHPYEVRLTGLIPDRQVRCQLHDDTDTVLATELQGARAGELSILFKEKTPDLTATCDYVESSTSIRPSTGPVVRRFGS